MLNIKLNLTHRSYYNLLLTDATSNLGFGLMENGLYLEDLENPKKGLI
jgi:RsiW-degrading membrane proteinase PrsW (M82 family)